MNIIIIIYRPVKLIQRYNYLNSELKREYFDDLYIHNKSDSNLF